jgi:broad specificity phosphatase PhoE
MKKLCLVLAIAVSITSCTHSYYIVRHAEKETSGANMSSDVALSAQGKQRAIALRDELKEKSVKAIYSTNTIRTKSTAEPLRDLLGLTIKTYGPMPDSTFISKLKSLRSNTLVVGHSNTVDDIVNGLMNKKTIPGDLHDTAYSNLFVVKYRRFLGQQITFETRRF